MPLVAHASKTVRNKNAILLLMLIVFAGWFAYDGWIGYPANNDRLIQQVIAGSKESPPRGLTAEEGAALESEWPKEGWNTAPADLRDRISGMIERKSLAEGWKTATDIAVQRWLVAALCAATLYFIYWFLRCQKRRVIADETTLSPAPGVVIPWVNITKVDNRRWKKTGIVDLEYRDAQAQTQTAILDDYLVDGLVPILEELAQRADKAEFINPPEEATATPASKPEPPASM